MSRIPARGRGPAAAFVALCAGLTGLEASAAEVIRYVDSRGTITLYYRPDPEYVPRTGEDSPSASERERSLVPLIERIAVEHAVDPLLVRAVMRVESNFHPDAVSPKGAKGLMQLMPVVAAFYGVQDVFDIEQNIRGGVLFLRHLQSRYGDDLQTLLAAYNAGETAVERAGGAMPAIGETQQYVVDVLHQYQKRGGSTDARPVPAVARGTVQGPARRPREEPSRPIRIHFDSKGNLVITNVP